MRISILTMFASMLAFIGGVQASPCPGTNIVQDPPTFQWQYNSQYDYWSGTLEIGEANLTLGGDTLTTRAYRQPGGSFSIPGPTMNMTPGNKYVLTLKNLLPFEAEDPTENVFKNPNITNIHTHGLHISGETPGDDVTRKINGGMCGDYVYDIPADHMGGSYWYHAHKHGSTMLQVSGGAFGMIVVDDQNDNIPPAVAGMTERQMVVGFVDPGVAGNGGDTLISGTFSPGWTVNGAVNGNVCMPVDEWQHWRVLLADRDAKMKTVSVGDTCEMALLARDGVWRTDAPKLLPTKSINLTGASRADLAIRCSADSALSVGNTEVATIYADGNLPADTTTIGPYSTGAEGVEFDWSANRPTYLRDLRNLPGTTAINTESVNLGARTINGSKFDPLTSTFDLAPNAVQEWAIKGSGQHPFHKHVYHVQPQQTCGDFEAGEYYDVLSAGNCTVRFDLNAATSSVYEGRTIMHCHILEHEDQGAMGWLDVRNDLLVGGEPLAKPPPTFPADPNVNFQALYQCPV